MVIRLGRNGRFLACSLFPEHKESRPLPGDEAPAAGRRGRGLPAVRRGDARRQERPVRAVRRLLALPGLQLHQEGGPAATGSAPVRGDLPEERRRPPRRAARPPNRQRLLGLLGLPEVRLHDELRTGRGRPRCGRGTGRAEGRDRHLPPLRRRRAVAGGRGPRRSATGGRPAEPRGAREAGPWAALAAAADAAVPRADGRGRPTGSRSRRRHPGGAAPDPNDRERPGRVSGAPAAEPALERFLRGLAARDASLHTQRSYRTAIGAYLAWLTERGVDWRAPARTDLRAYLAHLGARGARSSTAQRLAAIRSFHRHAAREGLSTGDPWGAIATPRLPRRLPRVLEVEQVERLLAVVDEELAAADAAAPARTALLTALALRDRALVETAYAAGLRISELAAADLGVAGAAAGRDPRARQGPQGAGRAAGPAGARVARGLPRGRPAGPPRRYARWATTSPRRSS